MKRKKVEGNENDCSDLMSGLFSLILVVLACSFYQVKIQSSDSGAVFLLVSKAIIQFALSGIKLLPLCYKPASSTSLSNFPPSQFSALTLAAFLSLQAG